MADRMGVRLKWLGCAAFEMDFGNVTVVNDPWITPNAKTELTWEAVEKCDYITLTHGHYDHTLDIPVYSQNVDPLKPGSGTGFVTPSMLHSTDVRGTLVNHSEHRQPAEQVKTCIDMCKYLSLDVCACAESVDKAKELAAFAPQMIAFFNDDPEVVDYGTRHMRSICLFFALLALSHCIAAVLRGAGRAFVPMFVMLGCWCALRVAYVTVALRFVNELETVSRAYPITWTASSIIYLIYFFTADWLHGFDRDQKGVLQNAKNVR